MNLALSTSNIYSSILKKILILLYNDNLDMHENHVLLDESFLVFKTFCSLTLICSWKDKTSEQLKSADNRLLFILVMLLLLCYITISCDSTLNSYNPDDTTGVELELYGHQCSNSILNISLEAENRNIPLRKITKLTFWGSFCAYYINGQYYSSCRISDFPSNVIEIKITKNIQCIDKFKFYSLANLERVVFQEGISIKCIPDNFLENCSAIRNITIPNSVTTISSQAFVHCDNLNCIIFEEGSCLQTIPHGGFANMVGLTEIRITSLKELGQRSFFNCKKLTTIKFGVSVSISEISISCFQKCKSLISIELPMTVNYIGSYAFANCSSMKSFNFSKNIVYIGFAAFSSCFHLKSPIFDEGGSRIEIGERSFENCPLLVEICLPSHVDIHISSFFLCDSLRIVRYCGKDRFVGNVFDGCPLVTTILVRKNYEYPTIFKLPPSRVLDEKCEIDHSIKLEQTRLSPIEQINQKLQIIQALLISVIIVGTLMLISIFYLLFSYINRNQNATSIPLRTKTE